MPTAVRTMPVVASTREPTRSLRRPATGASKAWMRGWLSMIHPVSAAERCWTTWRNTAVSMLIAYSAM